jgi:L-lysine exporter family protein LysE/ArgO
MPEAALTGFAVGLSLILAIGAQNAFVLRQGLRSEHVGWVVAVCALSDAVLILAGVAGFGAITAAAPWFADAARWAGAAFLAVYGALRFRAAWAAHRSLTPAATTPASLRAVIGTCLMLTWANPHVYLDTLVLIGAVATRHVPHHWAFGAGACVASALFFAVLGFGARLVAPVFRRPRAWVVLDAAVGATMWTIAAGLVLVG